MTENISQAEFARRCGVSKQLINKMIREIRLVSNSKRGVDFHHPLNRKYFIECSKAIIAKGGKPHKSYNDTRPEHQRSPENYPNVSGRSDPGTPVVPPKYDPRDVHSENKTKKRPQVRDYDPEDAEREVIDVAMKKKKLDVMKLETSIKQTELKMRADRGTLVDASFFEDAFFSLLQMAINKFMGFPESIVDDIIALVLDLGKDARPAVIELMYKNINSINKTVRALWKTKITRMRDELRRGAGRSDAE